MVSYALASEEVLERIGAFIDRYVMLQDGSTCPMTVATYKEAFLLMIRSGTFHSVEEIKRACLREQLQMIPDFMFENVYQAQKNCQANPLDTKSKL